MLKQLAKWAIDQCVKREFTWRILDRTLLQASRFAEFRRSHYLSTSDFRSEFIQRWFPARRVAAGPFAGLILPDGYFDNALDAPKLLGCYESEISGAVERAIESVPEMIVNVGCAEGYYLVGAALRLGDARLIGIEVLEVARQACNATATANGVENRIELHAACTPPQLALWASSARGLLLCDCEGYEQDLLTPDVVEALGSWVAIVELHDFNRFGVSLELERRFSNTHQVEMVRSWADAKRAALLTFSGVQLSQDERLELASEHRNHPMEWLIAWPRDGLHAR